MREMPTLVRTAGAWSFITLRVERRSDGSLDVRESRRHRKGLAPGGGRLAWHGLCSPRQLNLWIGLGFAIGSVLFFVPAILTASPDLARRMSADGEVIAHLYFAGSVWFTAAAFLQLHQSAISGSFADPSADRHPLRGSHPAEAGWLASALQFAGTLLFNVSTFDAMTPGMGWQQTDRLVWVPDLLGSVLFLVSGYVAFVETCHAHWASRPTNLGWWICAVNLVGCIAFMMPGLFGYAPRPGAALDPAAPSLACTAAGALGFLVGGLLLFPESAGAED